MVRTDEKMNTHNKMCALNVGVPPNPGIIPSVISGKPS